MKKHKWALGFSACLLAFTVFLSLDTFVLSSAYQADATQMNTAMFERVTSEKSDEDTQQPEAAVEDAADTTEQPQAETTPQENAESSGKKHKARRTSAEEPVQETSQAPVESSPAVSADSVDARTYQDENISVTLTEQTVNGTAVYVADVRLASAEYLKTAFASDTYGKNVTAKTSAIAAAHDAILAVNGDYYGARERGYVIRNGVVYRDSADSADVLCVYADGTMEIVDPATVTAQELVERGVWQAFSFGPALVEDGAVSVSEGDEVGKAKASNPRTAVGMIDPLHYVFVVSDGRTDASEGLSLYELAQFMRTLGVETAYNLDGGGSSTMVFQGEVVNNPTTSGNSIKERGVSDIVYIG